MGKPLSSVRKFYFLEYFYVLLQSVEKSSDKEQIFELFKALKQEHGLGESKYKKLTIDNEELSQIQLLKYKYTFERVISESLEYGLIIQDSNRLFLTNNGKALLSQYHKSFQSFVLSIFCLMESKYEAFREILELLNNASNTRPGLIILPNYSPLQLHLDRSSIKTTEDIENYSRILYRRLERDIQQYLGEQRDLKIENERILEILKKDNLLPIEKDHEFSPKNYNAILSRFRHFWSAFFLKDFYRYDYSLSSFEIWIYRAKQIGIIHATQFYPYFSGKIVYPTSIVIRKTESTDFEKIYDYYDGYGLYIHKPNFDINQNQFIDSLVAAYFDLRRTNRSYFINLLSLKEIVCYNMKISEFIFQQFLDRVYYANLEGKLKIKISLEVDKLPEETKANYETQEPVIVDGKPRNIIAIDVAKGGLK